MKIQHILVLFLLLTAVLYGGCSKTEYEQEQQPYTDIVSVYIDGQQVGGSPLQAIVSEDSIIVYWNPNSEKPQQITPTIKIAPGATISPASGVAVPFATQTVYTITAENGDTKEYIFKVKTTQEIPVLSAIVGTLDYLNILDVSMWSVTPSTQPTSGVYLNLLGEYFLATGDVKDIKVYAQRLYDGYEFDLPLDTASATGTNLRVELPKFSNQQDTGRHKIWIKVGDLVSDSKVLFMRSPHLSFGGTITPDFVEKDGTVAVGQTLTMKYSYTDNFDGAITRYYTAENLHTVLVNVRAVERVDTTVNPRTGQETYRTIYKNRAFQLRDFTANSAEVKFALPSEAEEFVGGHILSIQFLYQYLNKDGVWTHLSDDMAIQYGQTTVMFSQRGTQTYTIIESAKK